MLGGSSFLRSCLASYVDIEVHARTVMLGYFRGCEGQPRSQRLWVCEAVLPDNLTSRPRTGCDAMLGYFQGCMLKAEGSVLAFCGAVVHLSIGHDGTQN